MKIKSAEFLISVSEKQSILDLSLNEFVFVGRSNSGKSSLINFLTNRKNLARTSSTPGFTKLINYFLIDNDKKKIVDKIKTDRNFPLDKGFLFIDLPGYGYAKAGKQEKEAWSGLIEAYLTTSKNIKKIFVLVDIRHKPSELDVQMINFLYANQLPFVVLATKADKIAKSKIKNYITQIAKELKLAIGNIIPCSSVSGLGRAEILQILYN